MKKLIAMLLAVFLAVGMFAGCGNSGASASAEADTTSAESAENAENAENAEEEDPAAAQEIEIPEVAEEADYSAFPESYPLLCEDGSVTITGFQSTNPNMTDLMNDYNDLVWWQEVSELTGLSFEWSMASSASAEEQFNLLVAASDLPALVGTANYYSDGITSAIENDVFVDLSEYMETYAPDYLATIAQPDVYPAVTDDNGSVMAFYQIGMEEFVPNNGVFLRGDLFEEQGIEIPETYNQYEEALLTLKDAYDLEAPIFHYTDNNGWLSGGENVKMGFSLDADGNCIYGPATEAYRTYLQRANKWYSEGLIYHDFYVIPDGQNIGYMVDYMSSGKSVVTFGYCEFAGMIQLEEGQYFSAGYIPRNNEGDEVHLTEGVDRKVATSVAYGISTNATEEETELLCMMMNYFYTEEGALFANYGVEGQTFEYDENGNPWYTELITNNPDGLTQTQALLTYIGYMVPCYADYTKYNISTLTTWADFVEAWGAADNAWDMPQVSLTTAEQETYSAKASDVETYLDETLIKFIIGDLDINDDAVWEGYLADLDSLGLGDMIDVYSAALERFNARAAA